MSIRRPRTSRTLDGVTYTPGQVFRVVAPGARLTGRVSVRPGAERTWRHDLAVGDLVTCTGFGLGSGGDPGAGIGWTHPAADHAGATHVKITPTTGGVFAFHPAPGHLEPVADLPETPTSPRSPE